MRAPPLGGSSSWSSSVSPVLVGEMPGGEVAADGAASGWAVVIGRGEGHDEQSAARAQIAGWHAARSPAHTDVGGALTPELPRHQRRYATARGVSSVVRYMITPVEMIQTAQTISPMNPNVLMPLLVVA